MRNLSTIYVAQRILASALSGGTVDVTAHEILDSGSVRELHRAVGGAWGGTAVDRNFETLLGDVIGSNFLNR